MHAAVQNLLDKYKIPTSSTRICGGEPVFEPVWNGQDLAIYWCRASWNTDSDEIISTEEIALSDHDLLHEIAHFVVATPEQKNVPEYGLGAVAFYTYHMRDEIHRVVDAEEGSIQERLCWFLCCYWGMKYNISAILSESPDYVHTWEEYLDKKIQESLNYKPEMAWQALIRFRKILETPFFRIES